jgi:hypothetical protein
MLARYTARKGRNAIPADAGSSRYRIDATRQMSTIPTTTCSRVMRSVGSRTDQPPRRIGAARRYTKTT